MRHCLLWFDPMTQEEEREMGERGMGREMGERDRGVEEVNRGGREIE